MLAIALKGTPASDYVRRMVGNKRPTTQEITLDSQAPLAIHDDLVELGRQMEAAAASAGLVVLLGLPNMTSSWHWAGEPGTDLEFIDIARHAAARIIYVEYERFNLKTEVALNIRGSDLDLNDDLEHHPLLASSMTHFHQFAGHDGEISQLIFVFMAEGIGHSFSRVTPWFDQFMEEMDKYIAELEQTWSNDHEVAKQRHTSEIKRQAEILAHDEAYARARNDSQRRYLVGKLFPDMDDDSWEITNLLELAALLYWDEVEPKRERQLAHQAKALVSEGLTQAQIMAQLGVTKDRVLRLLAIADMQ